MKKLLIILFACASFSAFSQVKVGSGGDITPLGSYPAVQGSNVGQDATHRFSTDAEKTTWNAKATPQSIKDSLDANAFTLRNSKSNGDSIFYKFNSREAIFKRILATGALSIAKPDDTTLHIVFDQAGEYINKTVANTFTAGAKQTFGASSSTAGLGFSGVTANPSILTGGDMWYRGDDGTLRWYDGANSTVRTVVNLAQAQTLTNKTIDGTNNTLSNIPQSSVSNLTTNMTVINDRKADYTPVIERKARKPNANWQYTSGVSRTVGAGKTYSTLTAAVTAASDGDSIKVYPGTMDLSLESGGYWLVNEPTKRLLIIGMNTTPNDVILNQPNTAAPYALRLRNCKNWTFKNLVINSAQTSSGTVRANTNTASSPVSAAFVNCVITNTATVSRLTVEMDALPTNTNYIELDYCDVSSNTNLTSLPIGFNSVVTDASYIANPQSILITNSILRGYQFWQETAFNLYEYNTQCITGNSPYVCGLGNDVSPAPTTRFFKPDIRSCSFKFTGNYTGHGLMIGRGIHRGYIVNDTVYVPVSTSTLALGLVVKSTGDLAPTGILSDSLQIEGLYVVAPNPLLIKGGTNNRIRYSYFASNYPDSTGGYGWRIDNPNNPDGTIASNGNMITDNTFIGVKGAVQLTTQSTAPNAKTSALTGVIDRNRYKIGIGNTYVNNDGTYVGWLEKTTFWNQDPSSTYVTVE